MKKLLIYGSLVMVFAFSIVCILWLIMHRKDGKRLYEYPATASSLMILHECLFQFAMEDPKGALLLFATTNVDLRDPVIRKRLDSYRPSSDQADLFHDGWGREIHCRLVLSTTNAEEVEETVLLWSDGKNGINENGKGDDYKIGPFVLGISR